MSLKKSIVKNRVWTIYHHNYDDSRLLGIYSTPEKAYDAQQHFVITLKEYVGNLPIDDWIIDE